MRASENPETEFNSRVAGICKECGNATLNNDRLPAFRLLQGFDEHEDECYLVCMMCGSHHVDLVVL
jgi:hypothetical protein